MTIRIGFIGTGGIAQSHVRALQACPQAQIAWVYDVNQDAARQMAEVTGAQVAESPDALLDSARIDAVYLCTPPFARGTLEETAAERGIALFVEKPLGLDEQTVRRKEAVIRQSGIIHAVGYCIRYYDTIQEARRYLQHKSIHVIQAHRFGTSHPAAWWWQLDKSGGHLVDAVTHQVDLIRYLAGEFQEVYANFGRSVLDRTSPDTTIYDGGALTFRMASGAVGTITESCVSPIERGSVIKLIGEDFSLSIASNHQVTIADAAGSVTHSSEQNMMIEQARAFLSAVETGNQALIASDYRDARQTLRFTLAANRSAEIRTAVMCGDN